MQAMILAAGLGSRMRPLTDHTPKPLLPVAGKPLLEYQIERLVNAGVESILINVSYLASQIDDFIHSRDWPIPISLSHEKHPLETAGGIQKALEQGNLDPAKPILLINGDIWCDYNFSKLSKLPPHSSGHLILTDNPKHNPDGDFLLAGDGTVHPKQAQDLSLVDAMIPLTFSGISLLAPELIPSSQQQPPPLALGPILRSAAELGLITGEHFEGYWLDVGTPERLQELEEKILKDRE
ncbi:nucleotidyltransferase family protein [Oceanospirillum sp.]|uniref:nucleotidyltransferase family protein n=1 Tax=Oceanospirillum sp. TaxID=2021254 RepID=UPI003A8FC784